MIAGAITVASMLPVWMENRSLKTESIAVNVEENSEVPGKPLTARRFKLIGVIILGLIGLSAASGNGFFNLTLPNILAKGPPFSASVVEVGDVLFIYSLSTGVFAPFLGSMGSRKPRSWIAGALATTGVFYLLFTQAHSINQVELVTLLLGISYSIVTPLTLSLLTVSVPKGIWGRVMGLYGAAEDVGILIGSSLGTFIWGLWGAQYSFIMMGSLFVLVAAICALATKRGKLA
jgi:MFS family permease